MRARRRMSFRILRWITLLFLVLVGAGLGLMGGLVWSMSRMVPANPSQLNFRPVDSTRIYSSDGVVLATLGDEKRSVVKLGDIPKSLQQATVAIEDKRFYDHMGFDPIGIARAVWANIRGRQYDQGASTITQQLARNVYLSNKKTLARKLQEVALAMALERKFTKQQILEFYLNEVYYGSGAYGVQSAARIYFHKPVSDLTISESATIAGLTQRPTDYSPFNDMEAAVGRRNVVLKNMLAQGKITEQEYDEARASKLRLGPRPRNERWKAPYFVQYVLKQVSSEYGESNIFHGGLQIYTTLDYRMQKKAEEAVREGVERNRWRRVGEGALVAMDPQTGFVRAMVGGTDFSKSQFNVATQGTPQPGSTFKPIVYTAAMQNNMSPYDRMEDRPILLDTPGGGKKWWPENYTHRYTRSRMQLKYALADSVNTVAVRVARAVGVDEVIKYARALGITSQLDPTLSLALGSAAIPPIEMSQVYCAFANGGYAVKPLSITKIVTSDGGVLKEYTPTLTKVMTDESAKNMDMMLRAVVTMGTGTPVRRYVAEARGKTGTTSEDRSAWFIGYTKEIVTAVWVGNPKPIPMNNVWGGNVCGPIWGSFMQEAVPRQKEYLARKGPQARQIVASASEQTEQSERPRRRSAESDATVSLRICDTTGLIARRRCPSWHTETFKRSEAPSAYCDVHVGRQENSYDTPDGDTSETGGAPSQTPQPVNETRTEEPRASQASYVNVLVCADTGLIANTNCPHVVRRRYREDLQPTQLCTRH